MPPQPFARRENKGVISEEGRREQKKLDRAAYLISIAERQVSGACDAIESDSLDYESIDDLREAAGCLRAASLIIADASPWEGSCPRCAALPGRSYFTRGDK